MPASEWTFLALPMSVWAVIVAALGVAASTAVAIAAFRASSRANTIAIQNRDDVINDGRRHERREFYDAGMAWLEQEKSNLVSHGIAYFPHRLLRLAHLLNSDTAPKLANWLWEGARLVAAQGVSASPPRKVVYAKLVQAFGDECALWVKDASKHYEWPPFTP